MDYKQYIREGLGAYTHFKSIMRMSEQELGIPPQMLMELRKFKVPEGWDAKYVEVVEHIIANRVNGVFLIGSDSLEKDEFAAAILLFFLREGRRVLFLRASSVMENMNDHPVGVIAFMGADMPGLHANNVRSFISTNVLRGRVIILGCQSLSSVEDVLSTQIVTYLASRSITVDLSLPRAAMPTF